MSNGVITPQALILSVKSLNLSQVIIQTYVQNFLLFIDVLFPMVVINIVPILILFIVAQKQLVEGLTAGAVKS